MSRKAEWYLSSVLVLGAIGSFFLIHRPAQADGLLHVFFLDVGQGDAIFVQAPDGTQILVDGGRDQSILEELPEVMPAIDRSIDLVVMTHPDADHLTGLVKVLQNYDVAKVLETGMACSTLTCSQWEEAVTGERAERYRVWRGWSLNLGNDISIEVLNPQSNQEGKVVEKDNNESVVLKLVYKNQSVLLTGDIESSAERSLTGIGHADFLKVAHHGSKNSTTQEFLNMVSPLAAFIQVGKNSYGHPSPVVIKRLENVSNLRYYRTDTQGRIELMLDGLNYAIKTEH